jgi:hypothetical protein
MPEMINSKLYYLHPVKIGQDQMYVVQSYKMAQNDIRTQRRIQNLHVTEDLYRSQDSVPPRSEYSRHDPVVGVLSSNVAGQFGHIEIMGVFRKSLQVTWD